MHKVFFKGKFQNFKCSITKSANSREQFLFLIWKKTCQYSFMSRQLSEYNSDIKQSFILTKRCPSLTLSQVFTVENEYLFLLPCFNKLLLLVFKLYHDGGLYHIETSPLICRARSC